ncbi:coiled-coil domain-containing protein 13 [Elysia marginata]|uniref:Coiled-coil domain-containing protein 13 n=1 Tax=Elysia marginata TaxID=1093978 RepID=A0AAV4G8Y4_9GAST|nr:coiled-coil domain-containing protein 13 [Elysia marginata]
MKRKGTARGGQPAPSTLDTELEDEEGNVEKEELLTKLEIQTDETAALKAALQRTIKAKDEDMKIYSSTLDQTKQVFLQALRQMKDKHMAEQQRGV